jgi:hypothetical protein
MSNLGVSPPIRWILEVALIVVPSASRDRDRHEFTAELHFVPRSRRLGYLVRVLISTFPLRAALTSRQHDTIGDLAMITKPLRCRLGRHDWIRMLNDEDRHPYTECRRCGTLRTNVISGAWIGGT